MSNVVIFGGSFNPSHMGHVLAACYLSGIGKFDEIVVVPVYSHPYSKSLVSYNHRYEMCKLAMGWIPKVTISNMEMILYNEDTNKPNYTYKTVSAFQRLYPWWKIWFAVGSDNISDVKNWEQGDKLLSVADPFVIGRAGYDNVHIDSEVTLPDISSTTVRQFLNEKESAVLSAVVPAKVLKYIENFNLYVSE